MPSGTRTGSSDPLEMGTLASDFLISMSDTCRGENSSWSLYPLGDVPAKDALSAPRKVGEDPTNTLTCEQTDMQIIRVVTSGNDSTDKDLISVLQIVLLQAFLKDHSANRGSWQVSIGEKRGLLVADIVSGDGVEKLFSTLVEGDVEWVDMVTGSGQVLGRVPRPLVHKYNLLHRGIGMFVTKDRPMLGDPVFPPLYTHQRTPTKRIFPSLYDMFVGGVSLTGELSELTARRYVQRMASVATV